MFFCPARLLMSERSIGALLVGEERWSQRCRRTYTPIQHREFLQHSSEILQSDKMKAMTGAQRGDTAGSGNKPCGWNAKKVRADRRRPSSYLSSPRPLSTLYLPSFSKLHSPRAAFGCESGPLLLSGRGAHLLPDLLDRLDNCWRKFQSQKFESQTSNAASPRRAGASPAALLTGGKWLPQS